MFFFALPLPSIQSPSVKIVFLGTGTPRQDPDRSGPAAAVVVDGQAYLVDCGPGVVRRAAAAAKKGCPELEPRNLQFAFVTHLHSDHTLGLPDLIFSPWVVGRTAPLEAYGPKGLRRMAGLLERAYSEDVVVRTQGLEHGNTTGYKVHVHEISPGTFLSKGGLSVSAFLVKHGSWKEAYGYRFQVGGKVIVFSGDTAPCDALINAAQGADILVHEVYSLDEIATENRRGGNDWPIYLRSFHTSTSELGGIANRCQPKLLVLTHILRRRATDNQIIAEVRQGGFQGPIQIANDLDSIEP